MPSGAFPVETKDDLAKAVAGIDRARDHEAKAARRHLIQRAVDLKSESSIPANWTQDMESDMESVAGGGSGFTVGDFNKAAVWEIAKADHLAALEVAARAAHKIDPARSYERHFSDLVMSPQLSTAVALAAGR